MAEIQIELPSDLPNRQFILKYPAGSYVLSCGKEVEVEGQEIAVEMIRLLHAGQSVTIPNSDDWDLTILEPIAPKPDGNWFARLWSRK